MIRCSIHALSSLGEVRWTICRRYSHATDDGCELAPRGRASNTATSQDAPQRDFSAGHSAVEIRGPLPYDTDDPSPTETVERQTFDLVVTVARTALPPKGAPRELSVNLIRAALERDPTDLHSILDKVLALSPEERVHLGQLIKDTQLSSIISAANTVVERLNFVGGLRKLLAEPELRAELREVDQLHPMVPRNLWLFGEEWTLARTEVGLTSVLAEHLHLLGGDIALEGRLESVRSDDGRAGRVDILLYRGTGDERQSERLIVELKRPSVKVGTGELTKSNGTPGPS